VKKFGDLFGYGLTLASLGYIAYILAGLDLGQLQIGNPFLALVLIGAFGAFASVSVFIGAYCWKLILEFINGTQVSTRDVFYVYLKSNIAKYLPGNVMHYAGRNYLGSKLGWKNSEMAFSSLLEYLFGFGLTGLVILLLASAGLVRLPPEMTLAVNTSALGKFAVLGLVIVLAIVAALFCYRGVVHQAKIQDTANEFYLQARRFLTLRFVALFLKMFFIALGSFAINGIFYYYLCDLIVNLQIRPADIISVTAALSIANYTSILTPGVPGGIGVKESVSVLLIAGYGYPQELLLVSLLVFRITCVLGDLVPFLMVKLLPK